MARRQQAVRIHFLIALTLAMVTFGLIRFRSTYQRQRVRTEYRETAQQLRNYLDTLLQAGQRDLATLAAGGGGAIERDAAALQLQIEQLQRQDAGRPSLAELRRREQALRAIQANLRRLQDGRRAIFPLGEPFLRAYFSPASGRLRPYRICVPRGYDGLRPYPAILSLQTEGAEGSAACYEGAIAVSPFAEPHGERVREADVLAVVEDVRHLYNVEAGRSYLMGQAAGHAGCWHLATHYPHLFAGMVALGEGAPASPWLQRPPWGAEVAGLHRTLFTFLPQSLSPVSLAENLQHCRVAAVQTTAGPAGSTELSRAMVQRLRQLGYPFEYLEFPRKREEGIPQWTRQYALAKVFGQPVSGCPEQFTFKTAHLRYNRAWWLTIDRVSDAVRFAAVEARGGGGRAELSTQNVRALTVDADRMPVRPRVVVVDAEQFTPHWAKLGGRLRLERSGDAWRAAQEGGAVLKGAGRSGPFSDVLREPFLVVYGTAGESELHKAVSRAEADRFARRWQARHGYAPPLKADAEVGPQDLAAQNLLIFGAPTVNRVAGQVAFARPAAGPEEALAFPARISGHAVTLGQESFTGEDVGVLLCHPNPFAPDRMVALVAGTTPAALYQAYRRAELPLEWDGSGHYHWFDYAVFDRMTAGPETFLVAGFFDNAWRRVPAGRSPGGAEWRADVRARSLAAPQAFPALASADRSEEREVALSDVRPLSLKQEHGALGFDRSYDGRPIRIGDQSFERGLGMNAPSRVSYGLGGAFGELRAVAGLTGRFGEEVDPRAHNEQIVIEVWGDGKLLAATGALSRAQEANAWAQITADLRGVELLELRARPARGEAAFDGACAFGDPVLLR